MVENWLRTTVADLCCMEESQVLNTSNFLDDLGVDSLDIAELMIEAEDHFDIRVDDADLHSINTFEEAVKYIEARLPLNATDLPHLR
jgi:acyl carrier protein